MESLEGKRGYPASSLPSRDRRPVWLPHNHQQCRVAQFRPAIILEGGEAYANRGTPKNGGRACSAFPVTSINRAIYEIPLGMNMKKFIYEVAGGIRGGKKLKAVIPAEAPVHF